MRPIAPEAPGFSSGRTSSRRLPNAATRATFALTTSSTRPGASTWVGVAPSVEPLSHDGNPPDARRLGTASSRRPSRDPVFHLAAQIECAPPSVCQKPLCWDSSINVGGPRINLLHASPTTPVRALRQSSTGGAIYGRTPADPLPTSRRCPARRRPTARSSSPPRAISALIQRLYKLNSTPA